MKFLGLIVRLLACLSILVLSGCGGGKDVNGSLTVVAGTVSSSGTIAQAPFTVTYTNPQKSDVIGIEISITAQLDDGTKNTFTYSASNSGINIFTFSVMQTSVAQTISVTAKTGDIIASDSALIPASTSTAPTLSATPSSSVSFTTGAATGSQQQLFISGGTGTYSLILNPSPNNDISASITGNVLTVIKTASAATTGSASIIVTDTTTPTPGVLVIPVTY
jgi:hypothetical protein